MVRAFSAIEKLFALGRMFVFTDGLAWMKVCEFLIKGNIII